MQVSLKSGSFCLVTLLMAALLTGCSAEAKRKRHLARAESYFQKGEYQKAEIEYLNVMRLGPLEPLVVVRLGTIYDEQGRPADAFPLLKKAKELSPDNLDVRYRLGTVLISFRQPNEAREEALFILDKQPSDTRAPILLADAATTKEALISAHLTLSQLAGGKDNWAIHTALAQLALREQKIPEAQREVEAAARLNPAAPEVNVLRATFATLAKDARQTEAFLYAAYTNAPTRSGHKLHLIRFKMQQQDLSGAKKLLSEILDRAPDYVPAWALRGQIALGEKDFKECDRITDSVLAWDRRSYELRLLKARSLVLRQQPAKALEAFQQLDSLFPDVAEVKYETAVAQVQLGSITDALKNLDDTLRLNPNYAEAAILRGELQLRTGAAEQAVAGLAPFTRSHPNVDSAKELLARADQSLGRNDEALAIYRALAAKYTNAPQFHERMGLVLRSQKKPAEARGEFDRALAVQPLYLPAAEELLDLDLAQKDFPTAEKRVAAQLKLHTNSASALMLQAKFQTSTRKTNEAIATLQKVVEIAPEAAAPYGILAQLYIGSGDSKRALETLKQAVKKNPALASAHMQMGMLEQGTGDYKAARESYEEVTKLRPRFALAWNNLGFLLAENLGAVEEGFAAASKARELAPTDPYTADTLGWIQFRKGNLTLAVPLIRESAAKLGSDPDVAYHLAMAEYFAGNERQAQDASTAFFANAGESTHRREIERHMAVLNANASAATSIKILEEALKADSHDLLAAMKLGRAYENAGQEAKARDVYETAYRTNPTFVPVLVRLASLYGGKLNDLSKATELAKAARKLAPNDPELAGISANLAARSGDYAAALALLQEQARSTPAAVDGYDLALAYFNVGQFNRATELLATYLKAPARNAEAAKSLQTLIAFADGKVNRSVALPLAQSRLARDKADVPSAFALALSLEQDGKFAEAAATFEAVAARDKFLPQVHRQLALLYANHLNDDAKALDHGLKAKERYGNDGELAKALGASAYRKGDYRYATQLLEQAVTLRATDADCYYFLGATYHKSNRTADAKRALNKAVALGLSGARANDAAALLKQI